MARYKQVKAWSVMPIGLAVPRPSLINFIFESRESAERFRGITEADIVRVLVKMVNK